MKKTCLFLLLIVGLQACSENYSNGERIGMITQFSNTGIWWKSWEGHLNLTQTGMNSSSAQPFDFSVDNDNEPQGVVATLDSAAQFGWKVKLVYHETTGKNFFNNRGETNFFVTKCEVLDKNPMKSVFGNNQGAPSTGAAIHDTIYVVIDRSKGK